MRIMITGVTSGIGRELALQYAAEPGAALGLTGRRADRLEEVAGLCRARGARVHTWPVDAADRAGMEAAAKAFLAAEGGADLVIANAGTGGPDDKALRAGDCSRMTAMVEVNVNGVLHTLVPFVPRMLEQGSGHLVAVASIAGERALPGHVVYSATKAAVRVLLDGFAMRLERHGVAVTTINPGFVRSELTAKNKFPMPFIIGADDAAARIRRAIRRRRRTFTFPFPMWLASGVLRWAPRWLVARLPGG